MRIVGLLFLLGLGAACKGKGDADAAADPAALKAQQDLAARRDALMSERKKLDTSIETLDTQITEAKAKGESVTDLEKQRNDLISKRDNQNTEVANLDAKFDQLNAAQGGLAAREAALATLERKLRDDLDKLGQQQIAFLKAQEAAAQKWKESCTVGGPTIVAAPVPAGTKYSRTDVDQMYSKAKNLMRQKGLLASDLGAGASLDGEAQGAMTKQDWVGAYVAAQTLYRYAESIKIDRGFIQAKHRRLDAIVKSTKRDGAVQKQLEDGLSEILNLYNNGNLGGANAKLNQLFSVVK